MRDFLKYNSVFVVLHCFGSKKHPSDEVDSIEAVCHDSLGSSESRCSQESQGLVNGSEFAK